MRLLANENIAGDVVEALRRQGHDVAWVRTDTPGISDQEVLARAVAEQRILITFDKDFGYLAFRSHLPASCGVILFRIRASSSASLANTTANIVDGRSDWSGHFSVVDDDRIRMIPLS